MIELTVLVPTRGRPGSAQRMALAFQGTCARETEVVFVVDADDPSLDTYRKFVVNPSARIAVVEPGRRGMVAALNRAAGTEVRGWAVGFMGDDHLPRTRGWDDMYLHVLETRGPGTIVYGDDLLMGEQMPTQCAMHASVPATLGYMSPPCLDHLCVDLVWRDWAAAIGKLEYIPHAVVEHLHPAAGKAGLDELYELVNSPETTQRDGASYWAYRADGLGADAEKLRRLAQVGYRKRLRPAMGPKKLARTYAAPHDHVRDGGPDHALRVDETMRMVRELGPLASAADLSCGNGWVLERADAADKYFGDIAPGYQIEGPIEETLGLIPRVDLFLCCETLEHLDDPDSVLARIRAKADHLVVSTPVAETSSANPQHYWGWDERAVEVMLRAAGWDPQDLRTTDPEAGYRFQVWRCS